MNWAEVRERSDELYKKLKEARAKWDALPLEEQTRIIRERKYKEAITEWETRVGALGWWADMKAQGYHRERPPLPGPRPRIEDF